MLNALLPYIPPTSSPDAPSREDPSDDASFDSTMSEVAAQEDEAPRERPATPEQGEPERPRPEPTVQQDRPEPRPAGESAPSSDAKPTGNVGSTGPVFQGFTDGGAGGLGSDISAALPLTSVGSHWGAVGSSANATQGALANAAQSALADVDPKLGAATVDSAAIPSGPRPTVATSDTALPTTAQTSATASTVSAAAASTSATTPVPDTANVTATPSSDATNGAATISPTTASGHEAGPKQGDDGHGTTEQGNREQLAPTTTKPSSRAVAPDEQLREAGATDNGSAAARESSSRPTLNVTPVTSSAAAPVASDIQSTTISLESSTPNTVAATPKVAGMETTGLQGATGRPVSVVEAGKVPDASELAEQIRVRLSPKRPEITVRLDPPELGRLHIKLAMRGGELAATVTADDARVARVFEGDVGRLYRTLDEAGIKVSEVEIRTALDGSHDSPKESARDRGNADNDGESNERSSRNDRKAKRQMNDDSVSTQQQTVTHKRTSTLDVVV